MTVDPSGGSGRWRRSRRLVWGGGCVTVLNDRMALSQPIVPQGAYLKERTITTLITQPGNALVRADYQRLALKHIDGVATTTDRDVLGANTSEWTHALRYLLKQTDAATDRIKATVHGVERSIILDDFAAHRQALQDALNQLVGEERAPTNGSLP